MYLGTILLLTYIHTYIQTYDVGKYVRRYSYACIYVPTARYNIIPMIYDMIYLSHEKMCVRECQHHCAHAREFEMGKRHMKVCRKGEQRLNGLCDMHHQMKMSSVS